MQSLVALWLFNKFGLSLAAAMESSGLARWLGGNLGSLAGSSRLAVYGGLALVVLAPPPLADSSRIA